MKRNEEYSKGRYPQGQTRACRRHDIELRITFDGDDVAYVSPARTVSLIYSHIVCLRQNGDRGSSISVIYGDFLAVIGSRDELSVGREAQSEVVQTAIVLPGADHHGFLPVAVEAVDHQDHVRVGVHQNTFPIYNFKQRR